MVEPFQVHEFVYQDVLAHPVRHHDQAPVQRDMSVAPARSPACALVANGDPADRQTESGRQRQQLSRQFQHSPRPQRGSLILGQGGLPYRQALPLSSDPGPLPVRECLGLPP